MYISFDILLIIIIIFIVVVVVVVPTLSCFTMSVRSALLSLNHTPLTSNSATQ